MKNTTLRILLIVLVAALALSMAGCKGESSPTAPTNTPTVPPTGGITPPTGATLTLTTSPANPLVSTKVTVTATATVNGQPVADGTAVQFTTTLGTFADTGLQTTIRTTTNGVATTSLSSTSAGVATITATVNNVTKTTTVTFSLAPVIPPGPNTTPTITSVCVVTGVTCTTPATGIPNGGQQVVINGTNFRTPVRVLFDPGNGQPAKEAFVNSVSDTKIVAVAPPFNITTGQTLPVTITVITAAGTATEQSVSQATAFTYQLAILTPSVRTLTPTSGSIDGGTSVAILGDAFQAPVQVFFNAAEAQVIKVTFNEIDVVSPTARDTNPNGSGIVTGPVDIKVRNVASGKETTFPAGFRYIAKMQITAVNPTVGSALGGTDVTIDGVGFVDPVTVDIGGVRAQVLKVSGTQILARTGHPASPCAATSGPVTVTNVNNGDTAVSVPPQGFAYIPISPVITGAPATATVGSSMSISVTNPGVGLLGTGLVTFTVNGVAATATPQQISNPTGPVSFSVVVPNIPLESFPNNVACGVNNLGLKRGPAQFPVVFTNATTGCVSAPVLVTVSPDPLNNPCVVPPPPAATVTAPASGCAAAGSVTAGNSGTSTITITNSGGQPLTLGVPSVSGANASDFTVGPASAKTVAPAGTATYTVTFTPSATGPRAATVTFATNDPNNANLAVCLSGTGAP